MKALFKSLALLALFAFFVPGLVRAQDAPPPPPPPGDQGGPGAGPQDQGGDDQTSFQTFYDQLGDQGTWVQTDDYGYVFQPNVTDPDWAPYTEGHWVNTDDGWTWVSDEPWGWATYHYGRWANIDGTGWVWIPGYRWAPAWVSWRYGGGYCGWAPLPPESFVGAEFGGLGIGIGFHFGSDVDVNFHIGAGCYNFVRVEDIGEPNYRGHFVPRQNNFTIINNTRNITNFNMSKNGTGGFRGVTAGGPPIADVNSHSRQHVQTVTLTAATRPGGNTVQGNSLAVFAPRVNPATARQGRPAMVSPTVISHPTFNRGDSITKPLAVTASIHPQAPTPEAIQKARQAQLHAPASAKIVTAKTPFKTTLGKPLTSLAPVGQVHQATTGVKPAVKTPNSNGEHNTANAPFTGETAKSHVSQPNQPAPKQTFHQPASSPNVEHNTAPSTTQQHTQQVEKTPVHEEKPAPSQNNTPAPHTETFHPSSGGNSGGNGSAPHSTPAPQQHQAPAPASHPAPSGGQKPSGGNSNDKSDDKNKTPGNQ